MRQVFLDTETTGLSPESGDRMIEIGCVELVNRRLTGRNLHFYLNPERRSTRTRSRCTACRTSSSPTSRCSRRSPTSCSST